MHAPEWVRTSSPACYLWTSAHAKNLCSNCFNLKKENVMAIGTQLHNQIIHIFYYVYYSIWLRNDELCLKITLFWI